MDGFLRDLAERRLLPVALVLILAIVAVPLLALRAEKDPAPPVASPVAAVPPGLAARLLRASQGGENTRRPKLGARRDPFAQRGAPRMAPATTTAAPADATPAKADPQPAATTKTSGGSTTPTPAAPGSATPARSIAAAVKSTPSKKSWVIYRADVRFGSSGTPKLRSDLPRLAPLPSRRNPVVLFQGVTRGGRSAAFLIPLSARRQGSGECWPRKSVCQVLTLRPGRVETLTVAIDGAPVTYALHVARIRATTTRDRDVAHAAYARRSPSGRCLVAAFAPLQYDNTKGTLFTPEEASHCSFQPTPEKPNSVKPSLP